MPRSSNPSKIAILRYELDSARASNGFAPTGDRREITIASSIAARIRQNATKRETLMTVTLVLLGTETYPRRSAFPLL